MRKGLLLLVSALLLAIVAAPAFAIQCVPYAREISGINLKGDAWQWWNAAAGVYERGRNPKDGAVLVFNRQGSMRHGHVSVITRVISSRLVLVDHANWAPARTAGRGEVTTAVPVLDVSAKNDWSQVRVWFHPAKDFGNRAYRTDGFVYKPKPEGAKRPAIHQAALHKAEAMFPSAKSHSRAEARAEIAKGDTVPPESVKTPAPVAKLPDSVKGADVVIAVGETTRGAVGETTRGAVGETAKGLDSVAPAATHVGTDGLIKVAKHVFRPRRPALSGEAAPGLDALLFN